MNQPREEKHLSAGEDPYERLWDERAPYFEVDYADYDMDLEFFNDYFGPDRVICELGCGTLRIPRLLPDSFKHYYGVDLSQRMLEEGRKELSPAVSDRVSLIHSGMQEVNYPRQMDVIFNMGNSFLMMSDEDKRKTLERASRALAPGGRFILEIYNPEEWRRRPQGQFLHLRTIEQPEEGSIVTLSYTQTIDEEEQVNRIIWFREAVDLDSREVRKNVFPIDFRFLEFGDAERMIGEHFAIEEVHGSFDREEFDERSRRMIFVCTQAKADGGDPT